MKLSVKHSLNAMANMRLKPSAKTVLMCLIPLVLVIQSCEDQVIGPPLVAPMGDERVAVL